jgi:hypothetical protein
MDLSLQVFSSLPQTATPGVDLFPTRGLDTRVLSINVVSPSSSTPLAVSGLATPINITLPLRQPSMIQQGGYVNIGQRATDKPRATTLVCPTSPPAELGRIY